VVVKSKKHGHLPDNLKEMFHNLCKYKIILNRKKYVFGVLSRKLLGYMVSTRGINTNPKKVAGTKQFQSPQTQREIQKLASMMAALKRFIIDGVKYPRYHGSPVMAQNFRYDWFPLAANDWGTKHPILGYGPTTLG
jgi:hypothetical protein